MVGLLVKLTAVTYIWLTLYFHLNEALSTIITIINFYLHFLLSSI